MRTQAGGSWREAESRVTDLGVVPPHEASAYFFALVPRLESASGKDRLLLPAVLADDAPVIQPLLALARDERRTEHTRRQAILWLGLLGDATVIPTLVQIARDDPDDGESRKGRKKERRGRGHCGAQHAGRRHWRPRADRSGAERKRRARAAPPSSGSARMGAKARVACCTL